jgi:hypothetical protein
MEMTLDRITITDSTTREELISLVNDCEEEIAQLETRIEDKNSEIESLRLAPEQLNRLAEAADEEAAWGRIHNTPHAKAQWIAGN